MITCGYYCDQCRTKYAAHLCKQERLPCRHDFKASIWVHCQAYGRHSEHVLIAPVSSELSTLLWLSKKHKEDGVCYIGADAYLFWGSEVERENFFDGPPMRVGEFLASQPEPFIRAFYFRWESTKQVPGWVSFKEHPKAVRARALVKIL